MQSSRIREQKKGIAAYYPNIQWNKINECCYLLSEDNYGFSFLRNDTISLLENRLCSLKTYKELRFAGKIKTMLRLLLNTKFIKNIQRIYLFGSYAYGEPDKDSDLDFGVVIDDNNSWVEVSSSMTINLWNDMIGPCDVLVFEATEFEERINVLSIERVIYEHGVIIYDRN